MPGGADAQVYGDRRARVLSALGDAGALILAAAPELRVGADGELRYLPDADLYYLTGYTEPEAVLVLTAADAGAFTLFVRERDAERERWSGIRGGVDAATQRFGADRAFPLRELAERLPKLVEHATVLYAALESGRPDVDMAVRGVLAAARSSRPRTGRGPHTVTDPRVLLGPLRRVKDEHEVELLREAARITVSAFAAAAAALPGAAGEWQIEAALEHGFRRDGATGPAVPSIVAGGANATVLHYTSNDAALRDGDLVLIDAGARYRMYCGDITRTLPVNGRFTAVQRAVYDVVLRAHDAGLAAARPGATVEDVHRASLEALVDGMIELRLLAGSRDEVIETGGYRRYFPHRTSHWLGLDVHDAGDYVTGDGAPLPLEPGMVLTVEPGLYVPHDDEAAPEELRGLGVRLEDDVLITPHGQEVLTAGLPLEPAELEARLRHGAGG